MFDFSKKLQEGAQARSEAVRQRNEIDNLFKDLASSLSDFLSIPVNFIETIEYEESIGMRNLLAEAAGFNRNTTGYKLVSLCKSDDLTLKTGVLFKIKRAEEGYPVSIKYDGIQRSCDNEQQLGDAFMEIIGDVSFHDKLENLRQ